MFSFLPDLANWRARLIKVSCWLALVLNFGWAAAATAEGALVIDVSDSYITVTSTYDGSELLLFGTFNNDLATDLIIQIVGPTTSIRLTEKIRHSGIWIDTERFTLQNSPGYYFFAATDTLSTLLDQQQITANKLDFRNYIFEISSPNVAEYYSSYVNSLVDKGLYNSNRGDLISVENNLFRLNIELPSIAPTGLYKIRALAVRDGEIIDNTAKTLWLRRQGFNSFIAEFARKNRLVYGTVCALISLLFGVIFFAVLRKIRGQ